MKKKGFTLIELLAVIIILAVIALIATPVVLNVVENARKSAFQSSANGYYNAARYLYDELYLNNDRQDLTFTFDNGVQNSSNENYKLQVKGQIPKGGLVYLGENGQISVSIHNGKYCAIVNEAGKVNISDNIKNCGYIPEECFQIKNEFISKEEIFIMPSLDYSEDWMNASYNMLYYDRENENCPTTVETLVIPSQVNGERVEGIGAITFSGVEASYVDVELNIKKIIIPSGVKVIEQGAFAYLFSLEEISLPETLIYLGAGSFAASGLNNITLPNSLLYIDLAAFENDYTYPNFSTIVIPDSVTTIAEEAFYGIGLKEVTIGNGVKKIGDYAFYDNQLTSITIPNSVTTIGSSAFNNNQLPEEQAIIYKRNSDGTEDKTTIVSYGGAKRDNIIIPSGVTTIENNAFSSNQLTSVIIPSSVTSIGDYAFIGNQLTSITIPNSVTTIGYGAFKNNQFSNASSITIEGDSTRFDSNWTDIGFPAK